MVGDVVVFDNDLKILRSLIEERFVKEVKEFIVFEVVMKLGVVFLYFM